MSSDRSIHASDFFSSIHINIVHDNIDREFMLLLK